MREFKEICVRRGEVSTDLPWYALPGDAIWSTLNVFGVINPFHSFLAEKMLVLPWLLWFSGI